jgi:hypothetical protein
MTPAIAAQLLAEVLEFLQKEAAESPPAQKERR